MGLQPKFSVVDSIDSVVIYDCTGKASGHNPGGLGGQNPSVSDINSVILEVKSMATGKVFTKQLWPTFPSITELGILLDASFFSSADARVPSGVYVFKLIYSGPNIGRITVSDEFIFTKALRHDVDQLRTLSLNDPPSSVKSKLADEMSRLMERVEWAAGTCSASVSAQNMITYINKQVNSCC